MFKVIYRKNNGEIIIRERYTYPTYAIGEYTSMGWKVEDVLWQYRNNYYTYEEYCQQKRNRR